jgi:type 1 fimbria pilin
VNTASRIYGERGSIVTTRMLSAPQGENIAGMGIQITGNNMGQTTIRRGHSVQFDDDISKSIMRWFDISPEYNSGLNATMVFNYFLGEVNIPAQFEDVGFSLYKRASEPEEWIHIESTLNTVERKLTATNLGGFSRWTAGSSLIHLPVALLSFDAVVSNNEVVLQWTTASEINNDYFSIERSTDGRSFETVGIVNGAGNSNRLITYTKNDPEPVKGISYYRLKQIDYDGSFEYSQLVSVKFSETKPSEILLYPNPNNGVFRVQNTGAEEIPFRINDMQGRLVVASETDPMSIKEFNHSNLKAGLYTIVFEGENLHAIKMQVR